MTTDLIDRLRVIRDKRTTTPADGRVITEAMSALTPQADKARGEAAKLPAKWRAEADTCTNTCSNEDRGYNNAQYQLADELEAALTTPQPQGDASPQVSGGGEALSTDEVIERCKSVGIKWIEPDVDPDGFPGSFDMVTMDEMRALFAALSTPQARPDGYDDGSGRARDWREPAPTVDGGEAA